MKVCPVCKTTLFEDMDICYGCMYHFGSNPELENRMKEENEQAQTEAMQSEKTPVAVSSCKEQNDKNDENSEKEEHIQQDEQIPAKRESSEDGHPLVVRFEVRHGDALNQTWSVEATLPLTLQQNFSALPGEKLKSTA